ncbi:MAG: GNAT family N-acetyltransferase [Pirellulales bacterium]
MGNGITFRPIADDDLPFLFAVYAHTRLGELSMAPWTEEQKIAFLRQQFHAQHTYYQQVFPSASFQVILLKDQPIGRLYVHQTPEELRIVDIALLPSARGRGIGGAILRDLMAAAAGTGQVVRIHVERENPALRLYQRLGFQRIEDLGVYFLMEWMPPAGELSQSSISSFGC